MEKKLSSNDIVSFIILILIAIGIMCNIIITKNNEAMVGKQVVVDKDTITVIGYSTEENMFHLSNNNVVDRKFIKNNIVE